MRNRVLSFVVGMVALLLPWVPWMGADAAEPGTGTVLQPRVETVDPGPGSSAPRMVSGGTGGAVQEAPTEVLEPQEIAEESLPDAAGDGVGFYPPLALVKQVAGRGSTHLNPYLTPHLTLFLAEWALNAGAALRNPEWLRIKAGALVVLERYADALELLENLPPFLFREDPLLSLQLARVYLANGNYKQARELYSRFLVEQSQHFQVKEAEKGMVMTVLAAGELDQAELLLGLMTESGDKRIRNDPDLAAAMGRLMMLKGRKGEAERWLKILSSMSEPTAWDRRRQWRRDVAELTVSLGDWSKGMVILEDLLAQYPGPATLALHARLMESASSQGSCGLRKDVPGERLAWLRLLKDPGADVFQRETALEVLLEEERQRPLGLASPEGVLAPERILPDLTSAEAAVSYAAHAWRNHEFKEAWALLQDVPGVLADAWRLAVLAADFSPPDEVNAKAWIAELPDPAKDPVALTIVEPLAAAMLGFTEKMDLSEAGRIRRFFARLPVGSKVRQSMEDILGLQAAMARELNEEPQVALTLYLELVLSGSEKGGKRWPWYVSETPEEAVVRLLVETGRVREAGEFKKLWMPDQ
ncbi:MAG: tetratricopeptide repeat protein [Magnetococcales bacterium]|nr:tetratricopeptide repeat protein [Magnetococcales bacterium]